MKAVLCLLFVVCGPLISHADDFLPDFKQGTWQRTILDTDNQDYDSPNVINDNETYLWEGQIHKTGPNTYTLDNAVSEGNNGVMTVHPGVGSVVGNTLTLNIKAQNYLGVRRITKFSDKFISVTFEHADADGKVYAVQMYTLKKIK